MKDILDKVFKMIDSIFRIESEGKLGFTDNNKPALIPLRAEMNQEGIIRKRNSTSFLSAYLIKNILGLVLVLFFMNNAQAQSYLSTGSNTTLSGNTTYSGGNIYSSAVITVTTGSTITFTGSVGFSGTSKLVIQSGATVIIQSGGLSFSTTATSTNAGSLIISGGLTVGGGSTLNSSGSIVVLSSGLTLNNASTLNATGPLEVRSGGLSLNSGNLTFGGTNNNDTIIGAVAINNSSVLTVGATDNLYVNGDITNNQGSMVLNGILTEKGNYQSWNTSSITGTGDITTTGSMNAGGSSSIFGVSPFSCSGPCDGQNACGRTATATPSVSSLCPGNSVTLTGTITGTGTKTYQWYSSSTSGGTYTAISGATAATYTTTLSTTTYYKVKITVSSCTTTSNATAVTVNACAVKWIGATSTAWATASNWSSGIVPTSSDSVIIQSGVTYNPTISTSISVGKTTINSSAVLTISAAGILNAYDNIVNNGTVTPASGSTVAFKGNSAQTITGVPILYNIQMNNTSGGVSVLSALTVKGAFSLLNGVLTTNSNLTINFDNGGNIAYNSGDLGSISGTVTGRRDVVAHTHYIAAPFNGVTTAQVQATTPLYVNTYWKMYTKTFDTQSWAAVTNTTTSMPLGTGFSLSVPTAAPLLFSGTYDHTMSLTGTSYSNAASGKYILVGNPYPSALDWTSSGFTKTNVANAVYYWDAANSKVATYIAGVGVNGATQYIPAMQAFMVTTTGTGGNSSISINNTARVNLQNPSYFRVASADETIRIKVSTEDSSQWDDAVVRFNENATMNFDYSLDAFKILNQTAPSVYTSFGTDLYAINSVPDAASLPTIPVFVKIPADGNYLLTVVNSDPSTNYTLIDKKLGTENLLSGTPYKFSGLKSDDAYRFQLQLKTTSSSTNQLTTGITSSDGTNGLIINSSIKGFVVKTDQFGGNAAEIEILDMSGKTMKVLSNTSLSVGSTYFPLELAEGAYLVKVDVENNTFTQMISLIK